MAGTIYALNGQHDDNNCNGLDGNGVAIAILDPDTNMEIPPRVLVNNVGNFFTNRMFPANYKVKVLAMGREAIMSAPITDRDGSCNFCHTPDNFMNAKGRIMPQPP
jgi:hypothetical protein